MSDLKTTNRGGKRTGAGRKAKALVPTEAPKEAITNDYGFDVVKEQIELYKALKKQADPKTLSQRATLLKDIAPYIAKKQPVASLIDETIANSVIEVIDLNADDEGIV